MRKVDEVDRENDFVDLGGIGPMEMPPRKHVVIYTDGCARGNPGPGGYGVVLLYGQHRKELSGGFRLTTNNRMEVLAAIVALESLKEPCRVTLHADSEYLVYGAGSAEEWSQQGWRLNPPKSRTAENERCDRLANQAAERPELAIDEFYEKENPSERPLTDEERARMAAADSRQKITREGQPCRKCGHPVERRVPRRRQAKRAYHYDYYFYCPRCRTMYLVEEAKRRPGDPPEPVAPSSLFDTDDASA